jgi:hypothetical protein
MIMIMIMNMNMNMNIYMNMNMPSYAQYKVVTQVQVLPMNFSENNFHQLFSSALKMSFIAVNKPLT